MSKRMFLYVLGSVLVVGILFGIFFGGFYMGYNFFFSMQSTPLLQADINRLGLKMSALHKLDKGENDKARKLLLLDVDTTISLIDSIAEFTDEATQSNICSLMKNIVKHRKEYASKYPIDANRDDTVDDYVDQILNKWESSKLCD